MFARLAADVSRRAARPATRTASVLVAGAGVTACTLKGSQSKKLECQSSENWQFAVGGTLAGMAAYALVNRAMATSQSKAIESIHDKKEFVRFLKKACGDKKSPEYAELYRFLLSVFQRADRDFDGLVGAEDFDIMVEMAGAIPRKFGFAPSSVEMFATSADRQKYRKELFAKIDKDGSGSISFDEWLTYSYSHICGMTSKINESTVELGKDTTKDTFKNFVIKAARDRKSPEYKELYDQLLSDFVAADGDLDGRITFQELDNLIEISAALPRRFGFAPPASTTYKSKSERLAAREKMFKEMDSQGKGTISFEEWLTYSYKHICGKAKKLDASLSGVPPVFVAGQRSGVPNVFVAGPR